MVVSSKLHPIPATLLQGFSGGYPGTPGCTVPRYVPMYLMVVAWWIDFWMNSINFECP